MYGLDFAVQLSVNSVDFSPGGAVSLPAVLSPLKPQRVAIKFDVVGGVGIPATDSPGFAALTLPPTTPLVPSLTSDFHATNPEIVSDNTLTCFRAALYTVFGAHAAGSSQPRIEVVFDGLELTGVFDPQIETIVRGFASAIVHLVVVPRLVERIPTHFNIKIDKVKDTPTQTITVGLNYIISIVVPQSGPSSSGAAIYNPAFEDDTLKVSLSVSEASS
jgi:hypothetical protein